MLEAIRVAELESCTVARMAVTAADLGFEGLVVRTRGTNEQSFDPDRVGSFSGIDIFTGYEITADDPSQASGAIGSHRPTTPLLIITGGTRAMNNFAVRQERIDVLADPIGDSPIDHVLVKTAKSNDVHLELNLRSVLRSSGGNRVRSIQELRHLWSLIEHYDAPFVVTGDPRSHLELRATRELAAVGETIDIDPKAITDGMAEWRTIIQTNNERLADDYVEPGVQRGRHEES